MTLQDWTNLAQVIGALAVIISLFYVGFQIKRNNQPFVPPLPKQFTTTTATGI